MTKKQHYVPQFYLRNFTSNDNKLWVFDRIYVIMKKKRDLQALLPMSLRGIFGR